MIDAHLAFRGERKRLHLGVCGSISAYKAPDLVRAWQDAGVAVSVTLTEGARRFISPLVFASLGAAPVYTSIFEDPSAPSPFASGAGANGGRLCRCARIRVRLGSSGLRRGG